MTEQPPAGESEEEPVYEFEIRWTEHAATIRAETGEDAPGRALDAFLALLRSPARQIYVPLPSREGVRVSGRLRLTQEQQLAETTDEPDRIVDTRRPLWRIGDNFGIHLYEASTPVATALTPEFAQQILQDHNDPNAPRARGLHHRPVPSSEIEDALDALHRVSSVSYRHQIADLIDRVDEGGINRSL